VCCACHSGCPDGGARGIRTRTRQPARNGIREQCARLPASLAPPSMHSLDAHHRVNPQRTHVRCWQILLLRSISRITWLIGPHPASMLRAPVVKECRPSAVWDRADAPQRPMQPPHPDDWTAPRGPQGAVSKGSGHRVQSRNMHLDESMPWDCSQCLASTHWILRVISAPVFSETVAARQQRPRPQTFSQRNQRHRPEGGRHRSRLLAPAPTVRSMTAKS